MIKLVSILILIVAMSSLRLKLKHKPNELETAFILSWVEHGALANSVMLVASYHQPALESHLAALFNAVETTGITFGRIWNNEEAGRRMAALLHEHIQITGEVLKAVMSFSGFEQTYIKYRDQSIEIAKLASEVGGFDYEEQRKMMEYHVEVVTLEILAYSAGNYAEAMKYNRILISETYHMAWSWIPKKTATTPVAQSGKIY